MRFLSTLPKKITGAELFYNKLAQYTDVVFPYSGGSIMPLIDYLHPDKNKHNIKYYINTHEQNSGHAATGYSKSSDKTGVVITTSGPGITNMVTPMLDALNDSTPLVVVSGQVALKNMGTDAFQEAPAVNITRNVTKWSHLVTDINDIPFIVDMAFYIANNGKKGPVHIDLPKCILTEEIDLNQIKNKEKEKENLILRNDLEKEFKRNNTYFDGDYEYLSEIIEVINNSEKPILYIGQGCSKTEYELLEIANINNIPVTSTIHGKGIFDERHELSLEWCGMHGLPAANYALQEADCIIAVGSRFDDRTTGNSEFYAPIAHEKQQIIHIDIEKKQLTIDHLNKAKDDLEKMVIDLQREMLKNQDDVMDKIILKAAMDFDDIQYAKKRIKGLNNESETNA